jgi:hypothetical protein
MQIQVFDVDYAQVDEDLPGLIMAIVNIFKIGTPSSLKFA